MEEIQSIYSNDKMDWQPEKMCALRDKIITAPINVRVKPTNRCDHDCFYCSYHPDAGNNILSKHFNPSDEIPREKMLEILKDFKDIGVKAMVYSGGGEPLIYPHIIEAFKKTISYEIDFGIITNGQQLKGEKAELLRKSNWTRISLDTYNPETFVQSRRVSAKLFSELEKNITEFAKTKDLLCELGINCVVHHLNYTQIYEFAKHSKDLGINNIKFTPRWIDGREKWLTYHASFKDKVIEQIEKARQDFEEKKRFKINDTYKNDLELTSVPERSYDWCPTEEIVPVIAANCRVYHCHDKTYTDDFIGSIKDKSFKDLWFSEETSEIFRNFNPKEKCKQHCTYDARNIKIINKIKTYNRRHINFP